MWGKSFTCTLQARCQNPAETSLERSLVIMELFWTITSKNVTGSTFCSCRNLLVGFSNTLSFSRVFVEIWRLPDYPLTLLYLVGVWIPYCYLISYTIVNKKATGVVLFGAKTTCDSCCYCAGFITPWCNILLLCSPSSSLVPGPVRYFICLTGFTFTVKYMVCPVVDIYPIYTSYSSLFFHNRECKRLWSIFSSFSSLN